MSAENPTWTEEQTDYHLERRYRAPDGTSLVIRKMLPSESGESGTVVRELWDRTKESAPKEFSHDRDLADAIENRGLPEMHRMETVRRSVAATPINR